MKTNSKEVREKIKKHIIDSVYDENGSTYLNIVDASNRLYSEFARCANYPQNIRRIPNEQQRFSDYLQGLPFHFHFSEYDIQKYLNSLNINHENKKFNPEQSMKLYHYLIFSEMMKNKSI